MHSGDMGPRLDVMNFSCVLSDKRDLSYDKGYMFRERAAWLPGEGLQRSRPSLSLAEPAIVSHNLTTSSVHGSCNCQPLLAWAFPRANI
jgi:hypothetical protein